MTKKFILAVLIFLCAAPCCSGRDRWEVGSTDTAFKLFGPNHKVVVEGFRDPDFPSIVCYVSYAKTGGISGAVGLAEDPARFSLSLVKTDAAPLRVGAAQKREKQVLKSRSGIFRKMKVVRFYDDETDCFVYLATSTLLLDGSPFNALAAIPLH